MLVEFKAAPVDAQEASVWDVVKWGVRPEEDFYDTNWGKAKPHNVEMLTSLTGVKLDDDGYAHAGFHQEAWGFVYLTSGGNWVLVRKDGTGLAGGRRHGIPWAKAGIGALVRWTYLESQTPWASPMMSEAQWLTKNATMGNLRRHLDRHPDDSWAAERILADMGVKSDQSERILAAQFATDDLRLIRRCRKALEPAKV